MVQSDQYFCPGQTKCSISYIVYTADTALGLSRAKYPQTMQKNSAQGINRIKAPDKRRNLAQPSTYKLQAGISCSRKSNPFKYGRATHEVGNGDADSLPRFESCLNGGYCTGTFYPLEKDEGKLKTLQLDYRSICSQKPLFLAVSSSSLGDTSCAGAVPNSIISLSMKLPVSGCLTAEGKH
ncbi:hypothetical protein ElyMa_006023100 [Elysia marginata]|uniref:Uncharacterized protein n=1 Tax=Elysia marginata TaxID=1093978 RepID=A0AAV4GJK0_9GAST|nr:hypothetical protein ElyMa_006023100 [Elysia marginata]